jgi:hypothetical protein
MVIGVASVPPDGGGEGPRSGRPYSSVPSGKPRNSTSVTPTSAARPFLGLAHRPHSSGGGSSMPASPLMCRR